MGAGEENGGKGHGHAVKGEAGDGEEHYGDFEDFGPDGDGALAEAVGEIAAGHGKENEGEGEEGADEEDFGFLVVGGEIGADDQKDHQEFQGVVVEGALKLRCDEAPEAETPGTRWFGHAGGLRWAMGAGWFERNGRKPGEDWIGDFLEEVRKGDLRDHAFVGAAVCGERFLHDRRILFFADGLAKGVRSVKVIGDEQKAPASESGRYKGSRNPIGRGPSRGLRASDPLPYNGDLRG